MNEHEHIVIIGAQRSGSTFLYHLLQAQPEVQMSTPVRPEPKYFLKEDISYREYMKKLFPKIADQTRFLGEKSVSYYESSTVPGRIARLLPRAKLFMILRNPVERALSNFDFSKSNGLELRSLREAFVEHKPSPKTAVSTSVNPFDYLGRSDYLPFIKLYNEVFGDQLKILLFEDLVKGRENAQVSNFLDIDHELFEPTGNVVVNPVIRSSVPQAVRNVLIAYFAPKIDELESFLGKDLSVWRI